MALRNNDELPSHHLTDAEWMVLRAARESQGMGWLNQRKRKKEADGAGPVGADSGV